MDVEPDHDVEPALSLFSHVRPLRQDSHNTEGKGDQKLSREKIIKSICIAATLNHTSYLSRAPRAAPM